MQIAYFIKFKCLKHKNPKGFFVQLHQFNITQELHPVHPMLRVLHNGQGSLL